jgi:carboxyl-terminal processing protease
MKKSKLLLLVFIVAISATSCFNDDRDDNLIATDSINDFVWKGMNAFYIYSDNIPSLSNDRFNLNGFDNRFDLTEEYSNYLNGFSSPEDLFESLISTSNPEDRFSTIFPDLFEALQLFEGTSKTNGLRFSAFAVPGSDTEVFALIRLVLNNSTADLAGLNRGLVITGVDGTILNRNNFGDLLTQDTSTFNFADYDTNGTDTFDDDIITPNGQSTTVTSEVFTDNPVHRTEVINVAGQSIGYIMYNSFRDNFETELNQAFGELQAANVQHLVLDLRYNGGGVINTAARLGGMITGQFNDEIFSRAFFGPNRQEENRTFNFTNTIVAGAAINSLNLNKVYVITTGASASASELIINSLRPYIEVVQIGTTTTGKTTINRLVFDSPDYGGSQVNATHTYALFPLIGNSSNVDDVLVPSTGLVPNITIAESRANFGILGDPSEPLLAAAISDITGIGRSAINLQTSNQQSGALKSSKLKSPIDDAMIINE